MLHPLQVKKTAPGSADATAKRITVLEKKVEKLDAGGAEEEEAALEVCELELAKRN